jgi:integrase
MHAFRHFYASWRLSQNYNVKQVQDWLGHESAAMTLDVYGHLLDSQVDRDQLTSQEMDLVGNQDADSDNKNATRLRVTG